LKLLKKLEWPIAFDEHDKGKLYFTKEIQVCAENRDSLKYAILDLVTGLDGGDYKLKTGGKQVMLISGGDIIQLASTVALWWGEAKKNFDIQQMSPRKIMPICPLVQKSFLGTDNRGIYRFCDPSTNQDFPNLGEIKDTTIIEAFRKKEKVTAALEKMFEQNPDLSSYGGQSCVYCEENLHRFYKGK
jgi:hypothetical protein